MALTLDPATKVFTILQADLTLISGSLYELDTDQFRKDAMTLLANEDYIWLPDAYSHNGEVTVAGTTYARSIEWINGFSITFENNVYTVRLAGSNNNLFDVENGILNPSGNVTVISGNSSGLISANQLPGMVWQEMAADHNTAGTFGAKILTVSKWLGLR